MLDSDRTDYTVKRIGIKNPIGSVNVFGMTFSPLRANFIGTSPIVDTLYAKLSAKERLQDRLIVKHVHKKSPFAVHSISPGSLLHQINGKNVYTTEDVIIASASGTAHIMTIMKVTVSALGIKKEFLTDTKYAYDAEKGNSSLYGVSRSTDESILNEWKVSKDNEAHLMAKDDIAWRTELISLAT